MPRPITIRELTKNSRVEIMLLVEEKLFRLKINKDNNKVAKDFKVNPNLKDNK